MRLSALLFSVAVLSGTSVSATNFSFTGIFVHDNDRPAIVFDVGVASTVTLLTTSYAGGINAAGTQIARGGFDPSLSLYDNSGLLVGYGDDAPAGTVPADAVTGASFDAFYQLALIPGTYTVYLTQYDNFGPAALPDAFSADGLPNFRGGFIDVTGDRRDAHWAFDLLNVYTATEVSPSVPEPATWTMMVAGFGLVGFGVRRRRMATTARYSCISRKAAICINI